MDILGGIKKLFQDLINYFKSIYDGIVQFFVAIWDWLALTCELYFVFLKENFEFSYEVITRSIRVTAEWFVEQVKFLGKWLWETAVYLIDCCVTAFAGFIDWFLSLLPDIDLPSGFDDGIRYSIKHTFERIPQILQKSLEIQTPPVNVTASSGFVVCGKKIQR